MELYLIRHGEAVSKKENPKRPLSARGRAEVTRVAEFAAQAGVKVREIWHSGKTRAAETAEIMGQYLAPPNGLITMDGLAPNDDVIPVARSLAKATDALMVVGHLPFMQLLASYLLTGDAERVNMQFEAAGIVCLQRDGARWSLSWAVAPALLSTKAH